MSDDFTFSTIENQLRAEGSDSRFNLATGFDSFTFDEVKDPYRFEDKEDCYQTWQGLRGEKGDTGEAGKSVELRGPIEDVSELPESAPSDELWLVGDEPPYIGYFWNGNSWENIGQIAIGPKGDTGDTGATGATGADGTTFTPTVSTAGVISWTNDGGKQNPQSVNIKGPKGDDGATIDDYILVQAAQPTSQTNKLWVDTASTASVQLAELSDLSSVQEHIGNITVDSTGWSGSDPYTRTVTIIGVTATSATKVDLQPSSSVFTQMETDGISAMWIVNSSGTLTMNCKGGSISTSITIQCSYKEVIV